MLWEIKPETTEEILAVNALLLKMREEQQRKELIQKHKTAISFEIADSVSTIGLEETKRIVRELNRELRDMKSGGNA